MVISDCTVGMGITGSFCSFEKTKDVAKRLVDSFTHVTPVYSYNAQMMNTRFGKAGDFMHTISEITGDEGIRTLQEAERVGPGKLFDVMVIYPCTGNTAAKLANGIVDTPVLLAAKAHLRNGRPLVIGISTNDALGINFKNIGKLMNMKNIYFVPFGQDDCVKKPNSLVCDGKQVVDTIVVRDAACGHCGGLYTLRCPLHCAAKILYELCLVGFHRRTKTSKLAIHGSISPCLGVHASAFLCIMSIIQQYLSSFVIRGHRSVYSPPRCPQAASLTLWCNTL